MFNKRFTGVHISILWMMYLDPRFRKLKNLKDTKRQAEKSCLIDETVEICVNAHSKTDPNTIEVRIQEDGSECKADGKKNSINMFETLYDVPPKKNEGATTALLEFDESDALQKN